jgi:hypothetical protein
MLFVFHAQRKQRWIRVSVILTTLLALLLITFPANAAGNSVGDRLRSTPPRPVPTNSRPLPAVHLPTPNPSAPPARSTPKAPARLAAGPAAAQTACTPVAPTIDQRVLVITADGGEADMNDPANAGKPGAIQTALDYVGIPYEIYTASTHTLVDSPQQSDPVPAAARPTSGALTDSMLYTQVSDPVSGCVTSREAYYSGIITATGSLPFNTGSALSPDEWNTLWNFASQFSIRQVAWYVWPEPSYGFQYPSNFGDVSTTGFPTTLTPTGKQVFNYLNPNATIPIANATTYFAKPGAGSVVLLGDTSGNALIATQTTADGRETLAATFDANQYLLSNEVLSYGMVNWVTKGLFLGQRHIYATPQEDDLLIADNVWNISPATISSIVADGVTWTITTTNTPGVAYAPGQSVVIQTASPSTYNGTYTIASVTTQGDLASNTSSVVVINNATSPSTYQPKTGLLQQPLSPNSLPLTTPASPLVDCKILGADDPTNSLPLYRITGADVTSLTAWQANKRAPSGPLSAFFLSHAFNGWGTSSEFYSSADASRLVPFPTATNDSLVTAIKANQAAYGFINHTWGHGNLDNMSNTSWPTGLDSGRVPIDQNLAANDQLARGSSPGSYVSTVVGPLSVYDKRNLVQPDVSGLTTANTMNGAYNWGIRYVVSDTSAGPTNPIPKPDGSNPSPNAGRYNPLNKGILEVPRRPVNLYYLASEPGEWLAADNCLYPPAAAFGTQYPPKDGNYPTTGSVTQYSDLLNRVSNDLLPYMLQGDMDPWMFHQPNLRAYDGTQSLFANLMDALFKKYSDLYNLPVKSLPMDQLGGRFAARMAYNGAHPSARLTGGELTLTSTTAVAVPATLPTGVSVTGSESYGGQQLVEASLSAGQTTKLNVSAITVLPNDQTRAVGQPNPVFTGTVTGILPADASSIAINYSTTATDTSKPGTYPIYASVSGTGLGTYKYVVTTTVGTLTVTKPQLLVTINQGGTGGQAGTKLYGDPVPSFSGTLAGVLPGDTLTLASVSVNGLTASSPVGTYSFNVIFNDPSGQLANYTYITNPVAFTVTPAPLLVTFDNTSKTYGQINPPQSAKLAGFVLGQDPSVLGGSLAYTTSATAASPVGSYAVSGSGLTSANYAISYVPGTLTVGKAPLTITAADATRAAGEANPAFTGRLDGLVNGDSIQVTYTTTADASSPQGAYAIVPVPVDNARSSLGNYAVTLVNGTLTVTAPAPTVTPIPTDTPTPTSTETPSPTLTPTPTDTPTPGNGGGGSSSGGGGSSSGGGGSSSGGSHGGSSSHVNIDLGGGSGSGGGGGGASAGSPGPLPAPIVPSQASVVTPQNADAQPDGPAPAATPTPTPTQPAIQPVSASIDPLTGGALDTPEGRLHLAVPANATTDIVLVSVAPGELASDTNADLPSAIQPPPLFQLGSTRFAITALDPATYPVVGVSQHLTLSVDPDLADLRSVGGDRGRLSLAYFDSFAQAWIPLATHVTDTGYLTADSDSFGQFGVLTRAGTPTLCLPTGSTLWSSASSEAEAFGLAQPGTSFIILNQVGSRQLTQDSDGAISWVDAGALAACPPLALPDDEAGDTGGAES